MLKKAIRVGVCENPECGHQWVLRQAREPAVCPKCHRRNFTIQEVGTNDNH